MNLLKQRNLYFQVLAIKTIKKKNKLTPELLQELGRSVINHRDIAITNEVIELIKKFDNEAHKSLKDIQSPLMWNMYLQSNLLEMMCEPYSNLCLPYLVLSCQNPNIPNNVKIRFNKLIDEITYS
jgi:hypothetical protein